MEITTSEIQKNVVAAKIFIDVGKNLAISHRIEDINKTRQAIDCLRVARSIFSNHRELFLSAKQNLHLDAEIVRIFEQADTANSKSEVIINEFLASGVSNGDENDRNVNYHSYDTFLDSNLPKSWNFATDIVILSSKSKEEFLKYLMKRGQKRVICLNDFYKKISEN